MFSGVLKQMMPFSPCETQQAASADVSRDTFLRISAFFLHFPLFYVLPRVSLQSKSTNTLCYLLAIFQDRVYMNHLVRFADTEHGGQYSLRYSPPGPRPTKYRATLIALR